MTCVQLSTYMKIFLFIIKRQHWSDKTNENPKIDRWGKKEEEDWMKVRYVRKYNDSHQFHTFLILTHRNEWDKFHEYFILFFFLSCPRTFFYHSDVDGIPLILFFFLIFIFSVYWSSFYRKICGLKLMKMYALNITLATTPTLAIVYLFASLVHRILYFSI